MSEFTSGTYLATRKFGYPCVVIRLRSWGSATNRETWRKFLEARYSQFRLVEILSETPKLTTNQPLPFSYQCSKISQISQKLDYWVIHFDMILRSVNLFVIRQAINQIQNIGFGENATQIGKEFALLIETGYLRVFGSGSWPAIKHSRFSVLKPEANLVSWPMSCFCGIEGFEPKFFFTKQLAEGG